MNNSERVAQLTAWEKEWRTEMGAWFPGERVVVRGKDLLSELQDITFVGYILYGITGKLHPPNVVRLFDAAWTLMSNFPEPRLWNNRIATLAASARSTTCLGVSGGAAMSEAIIYGARAILAITSMLEDIKEGLAEGKSIAEMLKARLDRPSRGVSGSGHNRSLAKLPGFGRPVAKGDERIKPMLALIDELGFGNGERLKLIFRIEDALKDELNLDWAMNAACVASALAGDQGLSPRQVYQFYQMCFNAGILLCHIDAEQHPEGSFFPLRCSHVIYQGSPRRSWQVDKT